MATENADSETSSTSRVQSVDDEIVIEENLTNYLGNILKYQIVPMDFMRLRKLVKEAPQKLQLYKYIQEKYPAEEFLAFLQKYPSIFLVNPDKSVQIQDSSFCLHPPISKKEELVYDEVDGRDMGEYISDDESEELDKEKESDSDI